MLVTYSIRHDAPHVAAQRLSTVVARMPGLDDDAIRALVVADHRPAALEVWRSELAFPSLSHDPREALAAVEALYAKCGRCHLQANRQTVVFHRGDPDSAGVFVGEGPGRVENAQGRPFVGPSGRFEDALCWNAEVDPGSMGWLNLVGCRPAGAPWEDDRPPTDVERLACSERTTLLLRALRPRFVVCLGAESSALFWPEPPPANSWRRIVPRDHPEDWVIVGVTRHPAYLVRAAVANYKELFAARLFLRRLRKLMADHRAAGKVSAWRFLPRYVTDFVGPIIGDDGRKVDRTTGAALEADDSEDYFGHVDF